MQLGGTATNGTEIPRRCGGHPWHFTAPPHRSTFARTFTQGHLRSKPYLLRNGKRFTEVNNDHFSIRTLWQWRSDFDLLAEEPYWELVRTNGLFFVDKKVSDHNGNVYYRPSQTGITTGKPKEWLFVRLKIFSGEKKDFYLPESTSNYKPRQKENHQVSEQASFVDMTGRW